MQWLRYNAEANIPGGNLSDAILSPSHHKTWQVSFMKILLLGKNGQLGWELARSLPAIGDVTSIDYPEVDLARPDSVRDLIRQLAPPLIVNATAYTAVDRAESEQELAYSINAGAPAVLAEEAKALRALLVHYSTDYVFDGQKGQPYVEADQPGPLNVYGLSKLAGEQAIAAQAADHLILRTAWVYSMRQGGFVTKVLEWARKNASLRIVEDQVSNPTWARTLAELTTQVLKRGIDYARDRSGLYHLAGGGYASRFQWARTILELDPHRDQQIVKELLPGRTSDFPTPAERPLFSALDCTRFCQAFELEIPLWQTVLPLALTSS
jgi:dTDP-4-dehydrorhamnose reductase